MTLMSLQWWNSNQEWLLRVYNDKTLIENDSYIWVYNDKTLIKNDSYEFTMIKLL